LWSVFLGVDSYQFPAKNYGDLAFRAWGRPLRHIVNFLQALQLLISVGVIVISNGQALSQMSKFRLCYAVCCLLWALAGFAVGQVRTLQKFGILANAAVFLNLMIMFISMGVFAHSPPNYPISVLGSAGGVVDPTTITPSNATGTLVYVRVVFSHIDHFARFLCSLGMLLGSTSEIFSEYARAPFSRSTANFESSSRLLYNGMPSKDLAVGIFGLMQGKNISPRKEKVRYLLELGVYAYAGAQLFIEFMAELRRPRDFLKAMWGAQFFIYSCYMIYGCYTYFWQGQYSFQVRSMQFLRLSAKH
jgi:hypothetical protein